jgi:hypothetical protein
MTVKYVDIIIIGSGISGLYSAYNIKRISPSTSFYILEKYKKNWIGGRTSNDTFYGTEIVTGAGIGRKNKDNLLIKLLSDVGLKISAKDTYTVNPQHSKLIKKIDVHSVLTHLRREFREKSENSTKYNKETFKEFATDVLGTEAYKNLLLNVGYSDFENEDVLETLYYYGMEDNMCCWKAFHVPWKQLVMNLANEIGKQHFKFSNNVIKISKISENPCKFLVETDNNDFYVCNKVIIATTIDETRKLFPDKQIYNSIQGQPFLRLYAKFSKGSIPIINQYVNGFTFVPGPLQRIIPMNPNNGIYMIAYNDNQNTLKLKKHLKNTQENRELYETLFEKSLGIPLGSVKIIAIKDYYWPIGTHYYTPLDTQKYKNRNQFIKEAQHPEKGVLVVGEAVSRNQGWVEGALESVHSVLDKKWIDTECM